MFCELTLEESHRFTLGLRLPESLNRLLQLLRLTRLKFEYLLLWGFIHHIDLRLGLFGRDSFISLCRLLNESILIKQLGQISRFLLNFASAFLDKMSLVETVIVDFSASLARVVASSCQHAKLPHLKKHS
mmetsp:Transcript_6705/g.8003  ORF Transcript_6705/g.8003 Transcript_6705/m.8003 type:complete len:130 (-) Transcript_6705:2-391(-)